MKESLGERLRRLREARGLTQVELGKATDLHPVYLAKVEIGIKVNPRLDTLRRLSKALRVTVGELVD